MNGKPLRWYGGYGCPEDQFAQAAAMMRHDDKDAHDFDHYERLLDRGLVELFGSSREPMQVTGFSVELVSGQEGE